MARDPNTNWIPQDRGITLPDGRVLQWPGMAANGDFQGRPDDPNTTPSFLSYTHLSNQNRFFGNLHLSRGVGQLNENTTAEEMASVASPFWLEGGVYRLNQRITQNDVVYRCKLQHTATAANAPDGVDAATYWEDDISYLASASALNLAKKADFQSGWVGTPYATGSWLWTYNAQTKYLTQESLLVSSGATRTITLAKPYNDAGAFTFTVGSVESWFKFPTGLAILSDQTCLFQLADTHGQTATRNIIVMIKATGEADSV